MFLFFGVDLDFERIIVILYRCIYPTALRTVLVPMKLWTVLDIARCLITKSQKQVPSGERDYNTRDVDDTVNCRVHCKPR